MQQFQVEERRTDGNGMVTSEPHVTIAEVERQEVGNKGRQGTKSSRFDPEAIVQAMKDHYLLVIKVVLLGLSIICVGLLDDPVHQGNFPPVSTRYVALAYSTYSSYIIILGALLLGRGLGERFPWRTWSILAITGAALFIAVAAVLLVDWSNLTYNPIWHPNTHRLDLLCASGALAVPTAALFILDAVLTCRRGQVSDD
ncbi:uncharacterized protein LOC113376560 isoform X1 [Ctenocephalides felis]|uniref:uncharacterized protein LOC113376560 isoform X1 n=2 Tax=Ctenocephalides felis TaxID=7515 RepID=UPI000E6E54E3|nr:uncharacterized protein LOC113376560 isoform X1 [Ctenocephalides felis]XP_026472305.1 uncharacterized protein LOC113376560 isoform X1 [Ctenocephalides felis]